MIIGRKGKIDRTMFVLHKSCQVKKVTISGSIVMLLLYNNNVGYENQC